MGCDIHMYAEARNEQGEWAKVGAVFANPYYEPSYNHEWNTPNTDQPYSDRHYVLFAILADVRNGYGFAGVVTHKPVEPLFPRRGVPENASSEYADIVHDWNGDGHSHSYATLAELQAVDWASIVIARTGFLSEAEYNRVITTDSVPENWCGDVSGGFVRKVTPEVYETNYRNAIAEKDTRMQVYIQWFWEEAMSDIVGNFINDTIPALAKLGKPEDVRIVFFFDN